MSNEELIKVVSDLHKLVDALCVDKLTPPEDSNELRVFLNLTRPASSRCLYLFRTGVAQDKLDELERQKKTLLEDYPGLNEGYVEADHTTDAIRVRGQIKSINPPAAQPAQRKPLTDEQIESPKLNTLQAISDEYNAWVRHHAAGHSYDDFLAKRLAAHGIGEKK